MILWAGVWGCTGGVASQGEPLPTVPLEPIARVSMAVAARDLPAGHVVAEDDVRVIEVSAALKPPSAIQSVVGRTVQAGIWEHQPFVGPRFDPALAAPLKPGAAQRTLALPELTWALQHGDLLDVLRLPASGPCVAVPELFVLRTDDGSHTADVAGSGERLAALDAIPASERVILLRGYRTVAPPLPPCGETP